jgi:hypothetical protein
MASSTDTTGDAPRPLLAVIVSGGSDGLDTVRAALKQAGLEERVVPFAPGWWGATGPADLVVLDGAGNDIPDTLARAAADGHVDPGVPVLVAMPAPVGSDRQLEWLRAGAWDVIATPADTESLALFVTNLLRERSSAIGPPTSGRAVGRERVPYPWGPLVRATGETLHLAFRSRRPLACLAFVLDWATTDPFSSPVLLAHRLARDLIRQVRKADLVGISEQGDILIVLPDTRPEGADAIHGRLLRALQHEARAMAVITGVRSATGIAAEDDPDGGDSAAAFLLDTVRRAR